MSTIKRFEDLRCWQAARGLVKEVFMACEEGKLAKDFETKYQVKKSALSSMNNIAEGFTRYSTRDSIRFYDIAQSSAAEVLSMCYVFEDMVYIKTERIAAIRAKGEETKALTLAFNRSNRTKREREHAPSSTRPHFNTSTHEGN